MHLVNSARHLSKVPINSAATLNSHGGPQYTDLSPGRPPVHDVRAQADAKPSLQSVPRHAQVCINGEEPHPAAAARPCRA